MRTFTFRKSLCHRLRHIYIASIKQHEIGLHSVIVMDTECFGFTHLDIRLSVKKTLSSKTNLKIIAILETTNPLLLRNVILANEHTMERFMHSYDVEPDKKEDLGREGTCKVELGKSGVRGGVVEGYTCSGFHDTCLLPSYLCFHPCSHPG